MVKNCKNCKYKDRFWCMNITSKMYRNDGKKHIKPNDSCNKFKLKIDIEKEIKELYGLIKR